MAAAEQIKSLIKSFGEDDEERFFSSAIQIAATEARQGHTNIAQELKSLIEQARKNRGQQAFPSGKTVHLSQPKRELSELLDVFQPQIRLADMILDENVKQVLHKLIEEQRKQEVLRQHNLEPLRKLLLVGPPGSGKTMTAQAIAGELGIPVYIVRLDGIMSKFMGESIVKLRLIFDAMPSHRAVYLFDEFDSIGAHRHIGQEVGEIKRVLNSFLINIEKDRSNSIIIAATNLPESLDKALFRRFDEVVSYPLPNQTEILEVFTRMFHRLHFGKEADFTNIANTAIGLNFSDIVKSCEEVIKDMILRNKKHLSLSLLESAIQRKRI